MDRKSFAPAISIARIVLTLALVGWMGGVSAAHKIPNAAQRVRLQTALQHELDVYVRDRSVAEHLSSLSLAVSFGGGAPVTVTSGTMKFGGGSRVTDTDLYQIGSNTKAFTAIAVLQLEARGRLSIDAPIGEYLPQYPAYRRLTLRQLLSMTSGLESYDNLPSWEHSFVRDPMANVPSDSLIRLVYPSIKFTPGTKYYYSNTGYLLAQEVVAARSASKSFDVEIARIISSVGLRNTFYTSHEFPPAVAARVLAGYYLNNDAGFGKFQGKNMSDYSLSWAQGAGSIVSTPADLNRWTRAIYRGTSLLPAKQRAELMRLVSTKTARPLAKPTAADPSGFGLGVTEQFNPKLGTYWFYQGETLGFRAAHLYFPDSDVVVSLFANSRPRESESKLQALFLKLYASIQMMEVGP